MNPKAGSMRVSFTDLAAVPPPKVVTQLVKQVLAGDKDAETVFYESFDPLVRRFVRNWHAKCFSTSNYLMNEEDEYQNVMVRLMYGDRFTGEFRPHESPLKRWMQYRGERKMSLYRFVQWNVNHYLRDLLRANGKETVGQGNGIIDGSAGEGALLENFSETLGLEEQVQLRRCVRFCWKEMNPWYREVLELVGVMGYSQTETAQKLGISVATVNRWFGAARNDLRMCLEYNCPERILPFPIKNIRNEKRA